MKVSRTASLRASLAVFALIALFAFVPRASGQEQVIHSFLNNDQDGRGPWSNLVFDASGNLYGTTSLGGRSGTKCGGQGCGTVFELIARQGRWGRHILYNFRQSTGSGATPLSGVILDSSGNIYGTTQAGGSKQVGTVFELTLGTTGTWTQTILHSFSTKNDGRYPLGSLVFDSAGNLYGTTSGGGKYQGGTVFELSPGTGGQWTETPLYSFCPVAGCPDGANPASNLIFDSSGNLYGTTTAGGAQQSGAVFQLTPSSTGKWTETTLYSFQNNNLDGVNPDAGVLLDLAGNLYGTTYWGGIYGAGTVFELSPNGQGQWAETVLYSFNSSGQDAQDPYAGVIADASGNLYGTAQYGGSGTGCDGGCGAIFELSQSSGQWTESILYSFNDNGTDGFDPAGGLVFDASGNLYTTTIEGGTDGFGTVVDLRP
ncbi:MAG TPA: choice-of-anchor tandem repeat GloVer-containing protein [Terriglobales bacterium]